MIETSNLNYKQLPEEINEPLDTDEVPKTFVSSIYIFDKQEDLETVKKYYNDLKKEGTMFFFHTHAVKNALLVMDGKMEQAEFQKYANAMDTLK